MEAAAQSLKKGKSAGVDNIPAKLVQAGEEDVITAFTICNKIWQTRKWPTPWTQFLVITRPKKGNLQQCQNYQTINLISHPSKILLMIILNRLKPQAEIIAEKQTGFSAGRSITEQIFNLGILCEKYLQHQQDLYHVFIDFKKAFLRIVHAALWATMRPLQQQHMRMLPNNTWSPTGMSTLTHPFQHISEKDHDRRLRRSRRHRQH